MVNTNQLAAIRSDHQGRRVITETGLFTPAQEQRTISHPLPGSGFTSKITYLYALVYTVIGQPDRCLVCYFMSLGGGPTTTRIPIQYQPSIAH